MSLQRLATIADFGWLATVLLAHGAVLAFCRADHAAGGTSIGLFLAEILRAVQLSILPLWLILGPGPKRVRWIAIPAFFGLLYAWSDLPYERVGTQATWLGLETAGMLLILALAVRMSGGCVRKLPAPTITPPVQFSIRGILITTTLVALLIAGGKWVYAHVQAVPTNNQPDLLDLNPQIARTAVALGLALVSYAAWWGVFRPRHVGLAFLPVAFTAAGCGMLVTLLLHHESDAWLSFGLWWFLHALTIMATLVPLRQMGFRWAVPDRNSHSVTRSALCPLKTHKSELERPGIQT